MFLNNLQNKLTTIFTVCKLFLQLFNVKLSFMCKLYFLISNPGCCFSLANLSATFAPLAILASSRKEKSNVIIVIGQKGRKLKILTAQVV